MRLFRNPLALLLLILAIGASASCRLSDETERVTQELSAILHEKPTDPVSAVVWDKVREFYQQRENTPVWVEHKDASARAQEALAVLRQAESHGFIAADYGEPDILKTHSAIEKSNRDAADRFRTLAEFELRITAALMALGRDVSIGRSSPQRIVSYWKSRRTLPDLAASLAKAVDGDLEEWLSTLQPPHPEYEALRKALGDLEGQAGKGGWPRLPNIPLARGASGPAVAALRQRLIAGGYLTNATGKAFDEAVETAVKSFQALHAIKATGRLDGATVAAMNVPIERRIAQVKLNLERWRWMPDDLGPRHFLVNIPQYHLIARENGKPVMDIRVVVGKRGNETPVFSDEMEIVVFSPYWNIPSSIIADETAPAVVRDPNYLARNNMEIVSAGRMIDPGSVNWSDPASLRNLSIRQRPGADNALGHVKFLFPNDFDVYLHDTPADSLFVRPTRAFSHGCVRVEEPEKLAQYVLRGRDEWSGPEIQRAMYSGVEKHVKLDQSIPVHIVYFTAWVDERGGLHFRDDIYGYDEKQLRLGDERKLDRTHAG